MNSEESDGESLAMKEAFNPFISLPSLGEAVMPGRRDLGY